MTQHLNYVFLVLLDSLKHDVFRFNNQQRFQDFFFFIYFHGFFSKVSFDIGYLLPFPFCVNFISVQELFFFLHVISTVVIVWIVFTSIWIM